MLAVYNRAHTPDVLGFRYGKVKVVMYARNLSQGAAGTEVRLRIAGARFWEKNWSPFECRVNAECAGMLYLSYALSPEHVVISCELASGSCRRAYNTSSAAVWEDVNDR